MTNSSSEHHPGEFELIAKLFAPLARKAPGAYGLTDDAATAAPPPGNEFVITADMLTEGVHFRGDDPPDGIAKKALRTNLSDLAGKGAAPHGYLLSLALPRSVTLQWLESFARGLGKDQDEFGLSLLGGDTTATDGPLTVAITALGILPVGKMIRRNGARPGDLVFVSGTIGDSGVGLDILGGKLAGGAAIERAFLVERYRIPQPRLSLGQALRGIAHSAMDVSDGLLADLTHIADVSGVRICVEADLVSLSDALKSVAGPSMETIVKAVTAGDDYEIVFTAPPCAREVIAQIAARTATPVTEIGHVKTGTGVALLDRANEEIPILRKGFVHF